MELVSRVRSEFEKAFGPGSGTRVFFAPGRVNLIGEHIDYNGGFVFPMALTQGIYAVARPRHDEVLNLLSLDRPERCSVSAKQKLVNDPARGWANYPLGVASVLKSKGFLTPGADIAFGGDLPTGSGVSSSAALEVLTAYLLLSLERIHPIDGVQLALMSQRAEREFIGVQCGIMDQFAVSMARKDHAIRLNCATLEYEQVPVELGKYKLLVMNTNKERALAGSKYNERRAECEAAMDEISKHRPIEALCEATPQEAESLADETIRRRARHVVSEQGRVLDAVRALKAGDFERFGALLTASHPSLQHDYEVTGRELDTVVDAALKQDGCLGARMTGAGFGGCAIALVSASAVDRFMTAVSDQYNKATGIVCDFIVSTAGNGVRELQ